MLHLHPTHRLWPPRVLKHHVLAVEPTPLRLRVLLRVRLAQHVLPDRVRRPQPLLNPPRPGPPRDGRPRPPHETFVRHSLLRAHSERVPRRRRREKLVVPLVHAREQRPETALRVLRVHLGQVSQRLPRQHPLPALPPPRRLLHLPRRLLLRLFLEVVLVRRLELALQSRWRYSGETGRTRRVSVWVQVRCTQRVRRWAVGIGGLLCRMPAERTVE